MTLKQVEPIKLDRNKVGQVLKRRQNVSSRRCLCSASRIEQSQ